MSVEMQQLRHFCAVSKFRHFGKAADELAISQPALSRSIQNLEDRLSVRLLDRSRSGVALTPHGEVFLHRARSVLNEVSRAEQEMNAMTGAVVGSSTFALTPSFDHFILPEVIAQLLGESVQVQLSVKTGFYEDLIVMVRTGEIDFAIALMPEVHGHPEVTEEVIMNANFQVYCRPAHPLASRSGLMLADIAQQGWIVPDQPAVRLFERWFESGAANRPRFVVRSASMQLLKNTMQHCDLLSLLPDHLVSDEVARKTLCPLAVEGLPRSMPVALLSRRNAVVPMMARSLMDGIRQACSKLSPDLGRDRSGARSTASLKR